jgi:xylan 1,4-beta-xylosidase
VPAGTAGTIPGRPEATSDVDLAVQPATWGAGYDGQRLADRGDGTFLNPVFAGDRPDPSIIRDGDVYYLTFSSFDA